MSESKVPAAGPRERDLHYRKVLADPNPKLRRDALDEIIERRDPAALPPLLHRLKRESNTYVLSRVLRAVGG